MLLLVPVFQFLKFRPQHGHDYDIVVLAILVQMIPQDALMLKAHHLAEK